MLVCAACHRDITHGQKYGLAGCGIYHRSCWWAVTDPERATRTFGPAPAVAARDAEIRVLTARLAQAEEGRRIDRERIECQLDDVKRQLAQEKMTLVIEKGHHQSTRAQLRRVEELHEASVEIRDAARAELKDARTTIARLEVAVAELQHRDTEPASVPDEDTTMAALDARFSRLELD